jgi:hypothetical protein
VGLWFLDSTVRANETSWRRRRYFPWPRPS